MPAQALPEPDKYRPVSLQGGGQGWIDVRRVKVLEQARESLKRQQQYNPDNYHDWIAVGLCLHQAMLDGEIDNGAAFYLWCD